MLALPDPDTFQLLRWRPKEGRAVARMFCDILNPGGEPFEGDPRYVLKKNLKSAADLGYTYHVGLEMEYFYFKDSKGTETLDEGGYFDATPLGLVSDLMRDTVLTLEEMEIGVEIYHHERVVSQHEMNIKYTDALTMADSAMTCRLVIKQMALNHGIFASATVNAAATDGLIYGSAPAAE